ncbi:MAG: CYTH domain-containing protein [Wujia sp.]
MEIERKYLLKKIPFQLNDYTSYSMEQAYITTHPVIRVRKKQERKEIAPKYILTIKSGGMMVRQEYEIELDKEGYESVLKKAEGNIIAKDRYIIPLEDNLKLELDIFKGSFEGLIMGEVEFPNEEAANKFTPPDYISEEVTFDERFTNSTMSRMSDSEISSFIGWVLHRN